MLWYTIRKDHHLEKKNYQLEKVVLQNGISEVIALKKLRFKIKCQTSKQQVGILELNFLWILS